MTKPPTCQRQRPITTKGVALIMNLPQFTTEELNSEEWRPIIGYESLYEVSSIGRVRSLSFRNRVCCVPRIAILRQKLSRGYCKITLYQDGKKKTVSVHRLVATSFIDDKRDVLQLQVNHRDSNKTNNRRTNLEWVTPKENTDHAIRANNWPSGVRHGSITKPETRPRGSRTNTATITEVAAAIIKRRIVNGERPLRISEDMCISVNVVYRIRANSTWRHVPWPNP